MSKIRVFLCLGLVIFWNGISPGFAKETNFIKRVNPRLASLYSTPMFDFLPSKGEFKPILSFKFSTSSANSVSEPPEVKTDLSWKSVNPDWKRHAAFQLAVSKQSSRPDVSAKKIAGQFAGGVLGGILVGGVGLLTAELVNPTSEYIPAFISAIGYVTGVVAGVYLAGCDKNTSGSFLATAVGGILGGLSGPLLFWNTEYTGIFAFLIAPPVLSTLGFQLTRSYRKPKTAGNALLQWNSGGVKAQMPAFDIVPNFRHLDRSFFQVKLVEIEL